jgi:hypothetical protein
MSKWRATVDEDGCHSFAIGYKSLAGQRLDSGSSLKPPTPSMAGGASHDSGIALRTGFG